MMYDWEDGLEPFSNPLGAPGKVDDQGGAEAPGDRPRERSHAHQPGQHGDLYATVEAELPRNLTSEERSHYEALAKLASGTKPSAA